MKSLAGLGWVPQWNSPSDVRKAEFHPSTIFHTYRAGGVKRSEVRSQRSEIGGQRSEVGGQISAVGGHPSEMRSAKLNPLRSDFVYFTRQAVTSSISRGRDQQNTLISPIGQI